MLYLKYTFYYIKKIYDIRPNHPIRMEKKVSIKDDDRNNHRNNNNDSVYDVCGGVCDVCGGGVCGGVYACDD